MIIFVPWLNKLFSQERQSANIQDKKSLKVLRHRQISRLVELLQASTGFVKMTQAVSK